MVEQHSQGLVRGRRHCPDVLDDKDWLTRRYIDDGALISEIAAELGVSNTTVNNALVGHGIQLRTRGWKPPVRYPQLRDPEYMVRHLVGNADTICGLARRLGCAEKTVRQFTRSEPVASALADAGWDIEVNAAATQRPGRAPLTRAVTGEEIVAYAASATGVQVRDLLEHFGIPDTQRRRIDGLLDTLVAEGRLARTGKRPATYWPSHPRQAHR